MVHYTGPPVETPIIIMLIEDYANLIINLKRKALINVSNFENNFYLSRLFTTLQGNYVLKFRLFQMVGVNILIQLKV